MKTIKKLLVVVALCILPLAISGCPKKTCKDRGIQVGIPQLICPSTSDTNGALCTLNANPPTFYWQPTQAKVPGNEYRCELYLDDNTDSFIRTKSELSCYADDGQQSYTLSAPLANGTYYWSLQVYDTKDNCYENSEVMTFVVSGSTTPRPPGPTEDCGQMTPTLVAPQNGEVFYMDSSYSCFISPLTWTAPVLADSFELHVLSWTGEIGGSPIQLSRDICTAASDTGDTCTYELGYIPVNSNYTWYVTARSVGTPTTCSSESRQISCVDGTIPGGGGTNADDQPPVSGATCGDGVCTPGSEDCGVCAKDCVCSQGTVCSNHQCVKSCGNGVCDAGETSNTCPGDCPTSPWSCGTDADCEVGTVCEPGTGCASPKTCVPGCHDDGQCPADHRCSQRECFTCPCPGACEPVQPSCKAMNGDTCGQDGECPRGYSSLGASSDCSLCCQKWLTCAEIGGDYCQNNDSKCPAGYESMGGGSYDCNVCCKQGPSCGAMGGNYCSQSWKCPDGYQSLGTSYDCSPCCKFCDPCSADCPCANGLTCINGSCVELCDGNTSVGSCPALHCDNDACESICGGRCGDGCACTVDTGTNVYTQTFSCGPCQ